MCCQCSESKAGRGSQSGLTLIPGFSPILHSYFPWYCYQQGSKLVFEANQLVSHWSCLSGHTVEEATTISKSVISPLLSTFQICINFLLGCGISSYAFYLCRFITFKISFPTIFRGKGDKNHVCNLPSWTWSPRSTILKEITWRLFSSFPHLIGWGKKQR